MFKNGFWVLYDSLVFRLYYEFLDIVFTKTLQQLYERKKIQEKVVDLCVITRAGISSFMRQAMILFIHFFH